MATVKQINSLSPISSYLLEETDSRTGFLTRTSTNTKIKSFFTRLRKSEYGSFRSHIELDNLFNLSDGVVTNQKIAIVFNVSPDSASSPVIEWVSASSAYILSLSAGDFPLVFILDRLTYNYFRGEKNGLVAVPYQDSAVGSPWQLFLLTAEIKKSRFSGVGNPPYAGAKIPNT